MGCDLWCTRSLRVTCFSKSNRAGDKTMLCSPVLPTRRQFLRAAGVTIVLPWLDALASARVSNLKQPRRLVCICTPLGLHAENLFPNQPGTDYELSPYLDVLKDFRNDLTVISGLAHPDVE